MLCFVLCWVIWTAPLVDMPDDPARALSQAEAYSAIDDVAGSCSAARASGAIMAVPASLAAMRAGLPAWLGWLGVVAGIASLATVAFFGMFAWMAWIAGASIVLLVARREALERGAQEAEEVAARDGDDVLRRPAAALEPCERDAGSPRGPTRPSSPTPGSSPAGISPSFGSGGGGIASQRRA